MMSDQPERAAAGACQTPETEAGCFELMCVIVNFGVSSRVHQIARTCGISGETVFLGKGTVRNKLLSWLDLTDIRKEIIWMVARRDHVTQTLVRLRQALHLDKPNHGIAFSVPVGRIAGSSACQVKGMETKMSEDNRMFDLITIIVDKGLAEAAIEAAAAAGSRGGTIINARGSGIHETSRLFAMEIEPEKEIVMILAEKATSDAIATAVRRQLDMDQPGKGILFVMEVSQAYGIL